MAEYNEIPGRSDLFWKANDGFLNLYGIGSTGRRAARLGAPLRIVDEMIAVAPILVYAPDLNEQSISDFFANGGLKTRCIHARTGETEEAISLFADAAALYCEINPDIDGIRISLSDRFVTGSAEGMKDGHVAGEIAGALLLSHIARSFDMICHQYARRDFRIERDPVTLEVAPSRDGGHEARLRRFFGDNDRALAAIRALCETGKLVKPVQEPTSPRARKFDRTSDGFFVIGDGGYALKWRGGDKHKIPAVYALRSGRCLLPGPETLEFGQALMPVAVDYEAQNFPASIFSMRDKALRAAVIEHGARVYGDPSSEEQASGEEAMDWLLALCAVHAQLGKGPLTIAIQTRRGRDREYREELDIKIHNGRYASYDRYHRLLRIPIEEAIAKSGGLRPVSISTSSFDGPTFVRPADIEIAAGAKFLANNDSGHARLDLMSRARGPQWFSARSRENILRVIEAFRS